MESREILPAQRRLSIEKAVELYGTFGDGDQFESLVNIITNYERALKSVEDNFYKWRLDNTKYFTTYFKWNRVKDGDYVSFGKFTHFSFYDRLKKYIDILPKAEAFYEENRISKIEDMKKRNERSAENGQKNELEKKD